MARRSRETHVRHAQELNQDALLGYPNVIGVATGFRERGGKLTDEIVVQVFVERKVADAQLNPADVVPQRVTGWEGAPVQTDVIETTIPEAQQDTTRYRPVQAGSSIGPEATVSAGTLGGWACDNTDDTIVLLSNNHVISNLDTLPALRRIVQPARFDGGVLPGDVIGSLKRHNAVNTVANPTPAGTVIPTSVVDAAIGSDRCRHRHRSRRPPDRPCHLRASRARAEHERAEARPDDAADDERADHERRDDVQLHVPEPDAHLPDPERVPDHLDGWERLQRGRRLGLADLRPGRRPADRNAAGRRPPLRGRELRRTGRLSRTRTTSTPSSAPSTWRRSAPASRGRSSARSSRGAGRRGRSCRRSLPSSVRATPPRARAPAVPLARAGSVRSTARCSTS